MHREERRDNRGTTLVELLIALAVSAIIISGIAYMLVISLRVSAKNNAGVEVQSEVQTALNMMMDRIMEAEGICMRVSSSSNTDCVLLGKMSAEKNGAGYSLYYRGDALVTDVESGGRKEIYLVEFPNEGYPEDLTGPEGCCLLGNGSSEEACVLKGLDNTKKYITEMSPENRIRWLLGKDIVSCSILPESVYGEKTVKENGVDVTRQFFAEPFTLKVSLKVESDYGDGIVERELGDRAAVRNRIETIYLTKPGEAPDHMEVYERER